MSAREGDLFRRLREAGQRQGWWEASGMVVALSGGGDSVALGALLRRFWPGLQVWAHLDHQIRSVSGEDALFVEDLAARWGIRCVSEGLPVPSLRQKGESLEMAARRLRYGFLERAAGREGLRWVATAHTADDQAETLLLHLLRGSGIRGLGGMREQRKPWVRPLLGFRREELRAFLRQEGIPWREDASNQDRTFLRNRIRHELIPWMESCNPAFTLRAQALAEEARREDRRLQQEGRSLLAWLQREAFPADAAWDRRGAARLDPSSRVRALRAQGEALGLPVLDRDRCEALARRVALPGQFRLPWKGGAQVCGDSGRVVFRCSPTSPEPREVLPPSGGERSLHRWGSWEVEVRVEPREQGLPRGDRCGWLPCAEGPLRLEALGEEGAVPWWARPITPRVRWGAWTWAPGMPLPQEETLPGCAMIARVWLRPVLTGEVRSFGP